MAGTKTKTKTKRANRVTLRKIADQSSGETLRDRAVRGIVLRDGLSFATAAAQMQIAPPTLFSALRTETPHPRTIQRIRDWLKSRGVVANSGRPLANADLLDQVPA